MATRRSKMEEPRSRIQAEAASEMLRQLTIQSLRSGKNRLTLDRDRGKACIHAASIAAELLIELRFARQQPQPAAVR